MPYADAEVGRAKAKDRYYKNHAANRARARVYYRENLLQCKATIRRSLLASRYGVTPEDVEAMKAAQCGRCAICGQAPKRLCVDHNHETGRVRGLLCIQCNTALSYVEDASWSKSAATYLEGHSAASAK